MHEHSITNEVVHQIVHVCEKKGIAPKKIKIELGALTTFKKDPVLFYFENHKSKIDLLKNAELDITEVTGKIKCNECQEISVPIETLLIHCPKCESADVNIIEGDKVIIKEIE